MSVFEKMTAIADAIRAKTGGTDALTLDGMAEAIAGIETDGGGYDEGFADGAKSEYDKFWDNFQNYGNRRAYNYAFYGADRKWGDTFAPKYDLVIENANYMFMYNSGVGLKLKEGLAKNNVRFDLSVCTRATACFSYSDIGDLPELNLTSYSAMQVMFQGCKSKVIDKIILKDDGSQTFNNTFDGYTDLEEVRFGGVIGNSVSFSSCTKLSHDSLINNDGTGIINVLKDLRGTGITRTLTLGSTNLAKLTDAEKALATQEKGWTLA